MRKMRFKTWTASLLLGLAVMSPLAAQNNFLPQPTREAKPGLRWWWLGSAVDKKNLSWCLEEYAKAGAGAVEITPIYGVQGNEANEIGYLSPQWMEMLHHVEKEGVRLDIETDMSTCTGWPFGGPWVPIEEAACKAFVVDTLVGAGLKPEDVTFRLPEKEKKWARLKTVKSYPKAGGMQRLIALYESRTRQLVKRAAPGGEGYVVDHFDSTAVAHYLQHIEQAFTESGTPFPHTFFNDSYEVYGANWTPTLLDEFARRRGYRLEDKLEQFVDGDAQVVSDYRETLSDMLLANFTNQWTAWAHRHGAITRNQAHGSPANLIDCYAAVDIPEIEGWGLADFGIIGLRKDEGFTRPNDSDLSMLKYASSAAHLTGKKYTSSETFTWLTEHFRTSLSQMKPDLDLMFCAGVNRMFFHGTTYAPHGEEWPGRRFYASVDMSPYNSIWRDAPSLMAYITRCQTFLQWGQPDNDFLVYLPVRDMWRTRTKEWLMQFDIHSMASKAPGFIRTILDIDEAGFDCDYISDRYLLGTTFTDGMLQTAAGTRYKGLIIPKGATLPPNVSSHIERLRQQGAKVITDGDTKAMEQAAKSEAMKRLHGLKIIRRSNSGGHHYFIANLTNHDVSCRVPLAVPAPHALWYNPMNGHTCQASINAEGLALHLRSGESRILLCRQSAFEGETESLLTDDAIDLTANRWRLSFTEEAPKVGATFILDSLHTWENLSPATAITMGTGIYETTFQLSSADAARNWAIDLGYVRESARVYVNGTYLGCAWAVPFVLDCKETLRKGKNTLRIEVTNLPANRIADLDRKGVKWRRMKEINVVGLNYKENSYADWKPVASGLNGRIRLLALKQMTAQERKQEEILNVVHRTNDYFMQKYADPTLDTFVKKVRTSNLWTRAVYYEGLMALYDIDPQQRYLDYTDRWADHHKWTARGSVHDTDADNQCCQQTYIDRHIQSGMKKDLSKVKENLDHQMATGKHSYWTWIDAIQMAMPVYAKYARLTDERRYLDYAIHAYQWSRDSLAGGLFNQQEGLWWRDKDYVPPYKEKDGKNCYWSRGNGWVHAALVRVMETLPSDDPYYSFLKADFVRMSLALLKCQRKDGFWNVSLVSPATYGGPEMTGTALFLYGMAWGVRQGILPPKTFQQPMDKAWKALASCVHADGFIGYNQGTGKDPSAGQPVTFTSVPDFEDYGTGCFLLGAVEYFRLFSKNESWPDGTSMSPWFQRTEKVEIPSLGKRYVVTHYGVGTDSTLVQTAALQAVIDRAASEGGGVIVIPRGTFLSGALFFRQGTHLFIEEGGKLKGSEHIAHFPILTTRIEGQTCPYFAALVNADSINGFTIAGKGTIDGNGRHYWEAFWLRRKWNPQCTNKDEQRPRLVYLSDCHNVTVQDVTLANSPFWTNHLYRCDHVRFLGCHILSPTQGLKAPSSDAIDIDACHDVLIDGCYMSVNDDAVAIKGGKGTWADTDPDNGPCFNILIQHCKYGVVHSCLTLGSESVHDRNILLRNIEVSGADRVLWLKMRPDTPQHYEYVTADNITGTTGSFLVVRPWTQFFQPGNRDDMPLSQCNHITISHINMECRNFFDVGTSDKYSLRNFTFRHINVKDEKKAFDPQVIENSMVDDVMVQ